VAASSWQEACKDNPRYNNTYIGGDISCDSVAELVTPGSKFDSWTFMTHTANTGFVAASTHEACSSGATLLNTALDTEFHCGDSPAVVLIPYPPGITPDMDTCGANVHKLYEGLMAANGEAQYPGCTNMADMYVTLDDGTIDSMNAYMADLKSGSEGSTCEQLAATTFDMTLEDAWELLTNCPVTCDTCGGSFAPTQSPTAKPSRSPTTATPTRSPSRSPTLNPAKCRLHAECKDQGLTGLCCPAADGVTYFSCCQNTEAPTALPTPAPTRTPTEAPTTVRFRAMIIL
jgi:hypothetical protein